MPSAPTRPPHPAHETFYHLVIVDADRTRVVAGVSEGVWHLPYVRLQAHQRQWPPIQRQMDTLGLIATPIHEAYFRRGAASYGGTGWHHYVALDAQAPAIRSPLFAWHDVGRLFNGHSLFPIAQIGLQTCLDRLRRRQQPGAPFDAPEQTAEVHAWVRTRLSDLGAQLTGRPVPQRMGRFDAILTFPTTVGLVTFKGGPTRTAREARLVEALGALRPEHFPRLLATGREAEWWLTTGASGPDLAGLTGLATSQATGRIAGNAHAQRELWTRAVTLLAEAQRAILESDALEPVRDRPFGRVQIDEAIGRLRDMLARGPFRTHWDPPRLKALVSLLRRAGHRLVAYPLPWTWTPTTFTLPTLFLHGGRVGFDGGEECVYGPPTLAFSRFMDDLWLRGHAPRAIVHHLEERYVDAWRGVIEPGLIRRALTDSHPIALLLAFRTHADRLARADGVAQDDPLGADHPELAEHAHVLGTRLPLNLRSSRRLVSLTGALPLYSAPDWEGSRP